MKNILFYLGISSPFIAIPAAGLIYSVVTGQKVGIVFCTIVLIVALYFIVSKVISIRKYLDSQK